jgi:mannose-6-phosphate isomerase-like protein (cupin superfamily)
VGNLIWKGKSTRVKKPWGEQVQWSAPWGTSGKVTFIEAGQRTSKKMYKQKREIIYLLSGKAIIYAYGLAEFFDYIDEDGIKCYNLEPGDTVLIEPGSIYRVSAVEDSTLIEVQAGGSLGHNDADLTRFEDDYGRT